MRKSKQQNRGFTLLETAIVLMVIGSLIGGIWVATKSAKQRQKTTQAIQAVSDMVSGTRAIYMARAAIFGGISSVVPTLVNGTAVPAFYIRGSQTSCGSTSANYLDSPWGGTDDCGTLRVCAWTYGGSMTTCGTSSAPAVAQYFSVEFTALDYGSCVALASGVSPTSPQGLKAIFINGTGFNMTLTPSDIAGACTKNLTINQVDFIYSLRATGA